jgi:hypothetical protein
MKTTVEVPDRLYRQIKARAALRGQTIKAFFLDAVRDKLAVEKSPASKQTGWRAAFGAGRPEDVAEVQRFIDEECSKIDPEGWE